jgi:predicted PurR-regulated permease PerM
MEKSKVDTYPDSNNDQKTAKLTDIPSIRWILFLAVIYTLYFAQSLIIPLVLTILIALLLCPLVTLLKRVDVPQSISSIALLVMLTAPFTLLGLELTWACPKMGKTCPKNVFLPYSTSRINLCRIWKTTKEELEQAKPEKILVFLLV